MCWAVCHAQGRLPEALGHWQKAVEIPPDYAEVWQNIALAHEHLDLQPEAIAAHQQVVRLLYDNARATGYWAWLSSITDCCRLPIIVSTCTGLGPGRSGK